MRVLSLIPPVLCRGFLAMVELNFFKDQLLVLRDLQAKQLEVEIEIADSLAGWLIVFKMQTLHVGMLKSLVNCYSSVWIKGQHLLDEVDSLLIGSPEKFSEVFASVAGQLPHEGAIVSVFDLIDEGGLGLSN